jgi:hypothetical protein
MMESGTTNRLWPQRLTKRLRHRCPRYRRGVSQVGTRACSLRLATVNPPLVETAEYGGTNSVWAVAEPPRDNEPPESTSHWFGLRFVDWIVPTWYKRRPLGALLLSDCSVRVCVIFHGCTFFLWVTCLPRISRECFKRHAMVDGI